MPFHHTSRIARAAAVGLALIAGALAGCGGGASHTTSSSQAQPGAAAPPSGGGGHSHHRVRALSLSSPAFSGRARIPARFTCAGANASPPLAWSVVPASTRELAVVMVDLDTTPRLVHWALSGVDPARRSLDTGAPGGAGVAGTNGFGTTGYRGPCPPPGARPHRYEISVYALAEPASLGPGFAFEQLRSALASPLALGRLQARFGR